jgi:hypothetical protein
MQYLKIHFTAGPWAGTTGYQEISSDRTFVIRLTDANGNTITPTDDEPVEYHIEASQPEFPAWGTPDA